MSERCDIAIVGMSAVFPQAPDRDRFWGNILAKVDAVGEASEAWLGTPLLLAPDAAPDETRLYTNRGGFLGELSRFDPRPFGTMPVSVMGAEPDQFLALAAAADAVKDAGYGEGGKSFDRSRAGVILGHAIHANRGNINGIQHVLVMDQIMEMLASLFPEAGQARLKDVERLLRAKLPPLSADTLPGLVPNMMTGRICNRLDFMGPNYIMDAACASSLMAVEAAARELRSGRADLMLAGGVNTTTSTLVYAVFCKLGALSRSGRIRPFSSGADGTLLGEGLGILALKRLEDAVADDDRIYAVVKGIGTSSDGRSSGLMAPRLEGEVLAIRRAYEQAGVDPATIDLIEAHGTGIPLGDQTEITALRTVFGGRVKDYPHVAIGSVKSMIGHCIPAAGSAAMIKVAMALHDRVLPPTLCDEVSGKAGLDDSPFYVNTEARPWIYGRGPRRAGINAFGFGGINSHMVLEEAPGRRAAPDAAFGLRRAQRPELFLFAAETIVEMTAMIAAADEQAATAPSLSALAGTLNRAVGKGPMRLAVVAQTLEDLRARFASARKKLAGGAAKPFQTRDGLMFRPAPVEGRVAFMFPGENSQYPDMQRSMVMASPLFASWLDRLDALFGDERKLPHRDIIYPPRLGLSDAVRDILETELRRVDAGSEAVFFSDFGYLKLLRALGIKPDMIVGHSTGENAAILASGIIALSDDDICRNIKQMNRIFASVEAEGAIPTGVLITVGAAAAADIQEVLDKVEGVLFTMDNCPNQAVLFCPEERAAEVEAMLTARQAICVRLPMSWAYHTHFVRPMADWFRALFSKSPIARLDAVLYSCVTAKPYPDDPGAVLDTAAAQYVNKVCFTDTIGNMYADGARIFIEVGPGNTLCGFVRDILKDKEHLAFACDNPRKDGVFAFHALLGQLFVAHVFNDVEALGRAADEPSVRPVLPALPSELPLIHLDETEALQTRTALAGAGRKEPGVGAAAAPRADAAVAAGRSLPAKPVDDAPALQPRRHGNAVLCYDWTGKVGAPDIVVQAASLKWRVGDARAFDELAEQFLAGPEMELWQTKLADALPKRRQEWLLGRIAAKNAVSRALGGIDPAAVAIGYGETGQPVVQSSNGGGAPLVSISHSSGFAVAAASARPVGIDIELLAGLREPDLVADRILGARERQVLGGLQDREGLVATLWSIKEASAKTISAPFLGCERDIEITMLDLARRRATVQIAEAEIEISFRCSDRYVCALGTAN